MKVCFPPWMASFLPHSDLASSHPHTPTPHHNTPSLLSTLYLTSFFFILDRQSRLLSYISLRYTTLSAIAAARLPLLPLSLPEANIPDYGFLASTPPYWSTGCWRIGLSQLLLLVIPFPHWNYHCLPDPTKPNRPVFYIVVVSALSRLTSYVHTLLPLPPPLPPSLHRCLSRRAGLD